MKPYFTYTFMLLLFGLFFTSCYADRSTIPEHRIEEVVIDTTGIPELLNIGVQEVLHLEPKVKYSQMSDLTYSWQISKSTDKNKVEYEEIGTDIVLNYQMVKPKSNGTYRLLFTVTDKKHQDLKYQVGWDVSVVGSFIGGLVVADSKDDTTSDVTYIKNKHFTRSYTGEEKIYRNIFSSTTYGAFNSKIQKMAYSVNGYYFFNHTNYFWTLTEDGRLQRFDIGNDMKKLGDSNDLSLVVYKTNAFKVNDIFVGGKFFFLGSNEGYYNLVSNGNTLFSLPIDALASEKPSNSIYAATSRANVQRDFVLWLDEGTGSFHTYTKADKYGSTQKVGLCQATSAFDPAKMTSMEAITADFSYDAKTSFFLLKNKADGSYGVYVFDQSQSDEEATRAKSMYKVPAEGVAILNKAKSAFFSRIENVLYVVTSSDVYAFTFGLGNEVKVNAAPKFTLQGETISFAKLFVQGEFAAKSEDLPLIKPAPSELPYNMKALVIVSQVGNNDGVVRVVPIDPDKMGEGELLKEKVIEYTGFGKILDIIALGY